MAKRVLITGGTGFLGVHLSRYLLKKGYNVTLLDVAPLTAKDLFNKVTVINMDIKDKKRLSSAFKNMDYVVHAAAALPIQYSRKIIFENNVDGTKNVLEAALKNKVKRLIFISSTAVYGVPIHSPEKETDPLIPIGHYGESKVEGEKLCQEYQQKGLSINIVRPKSFLGPERLGVFTLYFEAMFTNKPIFILGPGNNLYQWLHVGDLSAAIESAMTIKEDGEIFNIGARKFGTWRQDFGALIKHARSKSKIVSLPVLPSQILLMILEKLRLSPIMAWHYKTLPVDSHVSIEKAERILSYNPQKSNQDILFESYDWYKEHRKELAKTKGTTHRTVWNFKILDIINKFLP